MQRDRDTESDGQGQTISRAVVDGGGETWVTLSAVTSRRIEDLATGEVIEIVSLEPSLRIDVPEWCRLAGHDLMKTTADGDGTRFWIRKR